MHKQKLCIHLQSNALHIVRLAHTHQTYTHSKHTLTHQTHTHTPNTNTPNTHTPSTQILILYLNTPITLQGTGFKYFRVDRSLFKGTKKSLAPHCQTAYHCSSDIKYSSAPYQQLIWSRTLFNCLDFLLDSPARLNPPTTRLWTCPKLPKINTISLHWEPSIGRILSLKAISMYRSNTQPLK